MWPAANRAHAWWSKPDKTAGTHLNNRTVMTSAGAMFSNASRNLRQLGSSPASWAWVIVILAIHSVVTVAGGPFEAPAHEWFMKLGLSREGFLSGKVWQVLSHGFLHGNWLHAGMNALLILLVGSRIEHMAGSRVLVKAVLAGIMGGGAGHMILAPGGPDSPLLVGLSGGCLALLLLLTTLSPQSRMMPLPVSGRSLGMGILTAELLMALMDPSLEIPVFSHFGRNLAGWGMGSWFEIGHACHLGGGLAGWAMGRWILRPRVTLKRLRADRERREASESRRAAERQQSVD